jgi:hypothetical protein
VSFVPLFRPLEAQNGLLMAVRRGLPLATTDRALRAAAKKVGVALLGE